MVSIIDGLESCDQIHTHTYIKKKYPPNEKHVQKQDKNTCNENINDPVASLYVFLRKPLKMYSIE